jgi:alpha-L-fucosidase
MNARRRFTAGFLLAMAAFAVASLPAAAPRWPEAHPAVGKQPRRPAGYSPFHYPRTPEQIWHEETSALATRAGEARAAMQATIERGQYKGDFASISTHRAPEWFLDAKFGMFVDWGPWSVAGWAPQAEKATYPDWYEQKLFTDYREYHTKTWGADVGPDDLIELLSARSLSSTKLAELAREAGVRYVVPFLKHHGGYSLWKSSYTHRNSAEWGIHRDVAAEMSRAFKAAGLRFGAYVSLGEWNYPIVKDNTLVTQGFNAQISGPVTSATPFLSGKIPVADYTGDYLLPSLKELIDQTSPDMLWLDGEWEADASTWRSPELLAYYYDQALARGQEVAVNDRLGKDTRGHAGWGDYYTSEYHVIEGFQAHPWEENRSLSHSYGYNWEESSSDRYVLSEADSLDLLLRVVANGGNLLLMVSPDGSGRIPPNQQRRLQFLGDWLSRNGEAIYATRPLGLAKQPDWGYLTQSKAHDKVYCIVRNWPKDGVLHVPIAGKAASAEVIGATVKATVRNEDGGVTVNVGEMIPPEHDASVIVLTLQ